MNEYIPHAITHHTKLMPLFTMTTSNSTDNFLYKKCFNVCFLKFKILTFYSHEERKNKTEISG